MTAEPAARKKEDMTVREVWTPGPSVALGRLYKGLPAIAFVCMCACGAHQSKPYGELADLPAFPAAQYPKVWIVADDDAPNAAIRSALGSVLKADGVEAFVLSPQRFNEALAAAHTIPSDVVVLIASAKLQTSRMARADQHTERRCSPQLAATVAFGAVGAILSTDCQPEAVTERYALFETDGALVMTLRAPSGETLALKELRSVARDRKSYPTSQVLRSLIDQARMSVRGFRQRYEAALFPLDDADGQAGYQAALSGDWAQASQRFERALQDPAVAGDPKSAARIHQNLAQALVFQCAGTQEPMVVRALEHARMATRLDPSGRQVEHWIEQRLQRLQYAAARQKEQAAKVLAALAAKSQRPVPAQPIEPALPTAVDPGSTVAPATVDATVVTPVQSAAVGTTPPPTTAAPAAPSVEGEQHAATPSTSLVTKTE